MKQIRGGGRKRFGRIALSIVMAGAATVGCSARGSEEQGNFSSDPERAKIERVVRAYILEHPEVITDAIEVLREREVTKVVDANRAAIETPFGSAWAGAEKGDVTLVEFFDYACSYCRASNPDIARLLGEDKNLKVVWRELPVLGDDSVAAAKVSLAAARQGKFVAFYDKLFAAGRPTPEAVAEIGNSLGINAAASPDYQREIDQNYELSRTLNASGTPTFVIGDKVLYGAVGYAALKEAIAAARTK